MQSKFPDGDFAQVQDDVNPHVLRMHGGTFSLDADQMKLNGKINL